MAPSRWNFESAIPIIRPSCKNDVVFKYFFFFLPFNFPFHVSRLARRSLRLHPRYRICLALAAAACRCRGSDSCTYSMHVRAWPLI